MRFLPLLWITVSLLLTAGTVGAQTEQKLLPEDLASGNHYGLWVSSSGDVAVVGAYGANGSIGKSGAAYVYRFDGTQWIEEQKLVASDGATGDLFGASVSVSGDVAVVAAMGDDELGRYTGAAYIFYHIGTGWIEGQRLVAGDRQAGHLFGYSVSVSGDVAVVAARGDGDNGINSGAAYVYHFDGTQWIEEQKLVASDGSADDQFGFAVSVSGDVAVVAAYADDDSGESSGSVYVYRFDGTQWNEEQKLVASDGAALDYFGRSVSISGDKVAVGSYGGDGNETDSGSAYIFRFDGIQWIEEQKLVASDGSADDVFGLSVSISGDKVAVGAYVGDGNETDSGSAYIFRFDGIQWIEERKLVASDGATGDEFGFCVSLSGDAVFVGAPGVRGHAGMAYAFEARGVGVENETPSRFSLDQSYPNPFNPAATISYSLNRPSPVLLTIHDALGHRIETLIDKFMQPGEYNIYFDATGLTSGVYFYSITAGADSEIRKMVLLR